MTSSGLALRLSLTSVTAPQGYDNQSNPVRVTSTYAYDDLGRQTAVTEAVGVAGGLEGAVPECGGDQLRGEVPGRLVDIDEGRDRPQE